MPLMYSQRLRNGSPLLLGAIAAVLLANTAQAQSSSEASASSSVSSGIQTSVFVIYPMVARWMSINLPTPMVLSCG